jgi:putative transcriptional regulator
MLDCKKIRHDLGLSQSEFSERFNIPLGTIRNWEQGRCQLDAAHELLLRTIAAFPKLVALVVREWREDEANPL